MHSLVGFALAQVQHPGNNLLGYVQRNSQADYGLDGFGITKDLSKAGILGLGTLAISFAEERNRYLSTEKSTIRFQPVLIYASDFVDVTSVQVFTSRTHSTIVMVGKSTTPIQPDTIKVILPSGLELNVNVEAAGFHHGLWSLDYPYYLDGASTPTEDDWTMFFSSLVTHDAEEYQIAGIKKYLLTREQQTVLGELGVSLSDIVGFRVTGYVPQKKVSEICSEWNAKLRTAAF
jgi:hypothetical protein